MNKLLSLSELTETCLVINKRLINYNYAVRGTASLVLQNLHLNVEDIDIICDTKCAENINEVFKECIVKPVEYSVSPKYKSYFGELNIEGNKVEIMGNYQIKTKNGWSEIYNAGVSQICNVNVNGIQVPCTTVSTELKMYLEMGRFNVYHKIKKELENFSTPRLFA